MSLKEKHKQIYNKAITEKYEKETVNCTFQPKILNNKRV